jgi:hypothetical protein
MHPNAWQLRFAQAVARGARRGLGEGFKDTPQA